MRPAHHPKPLDAGVARLVDRLDDDRYEAFAERAAILEYDARIPRLEAERLALIQTLARYGFPAGDALLLEAQIDGATHWLLTTDEASARASLVAMGATEIAAVDLVQTLRGQFRDLAVLGTVA